MADNDNGVTAKSLALALDILLNPCPGGNGRTIGFVLLTFDSAAPMVAGRQDRANYISNGIDTAAEVQLLQDAIAMLAGQPHSAERR